jgi:peptide/nickel transport system permease protein
MIKALVRELVVSALGRISLLMLMFLGGIALYVVFTYPTDFGKNIWNNPEYWADNPKSAPPSWVIWFDGDRARHRVLTSLRPEIEIAVNFVKPPTFLSLVLSGVRYESQSPIIEVYLAGANSEVFLYRHIVSGPRDGEAPPITRYEDIPYRANLTTDAEVKDRVANFLDELSQNGEKSYRVKVVTRFGDKQDDVREVKVVIGGDAYGWLGTDNIGRDIFKGILAGLPIALLVGLLPAFLATWFGALMGGISGYFGGKRDTAIQTVIDILVMLPTLPLLIYLTFVFGPNLMFVILILTATGWMGLSIKLRPWIFQIKEQGFVEYSRAKGFSSTRIILRHILPQTLPFLFAYFSFFIPMAILSEAGLSFIGLGDPSLATWGQMLRQGFGTGAVFLGYWWWIIPPGIAIVVTSLSLFLFFRSLEKAAEPRLRREE